MDEYDKVDRCRNCGDEMFPGYFGNDKFFDQVQYKRCMSRNVIVPFKNIEKEGK